MTKPNRPQLPKMKVSNYDVKKTNIYPEEPKVNVVRNRPQLSGEMEKKLYEIWYTENKEKPVEGWEFAHQKRELNAEHLGDVGRLIEKTKELFATAIEEERTKYRKDLEEIIGNNEVYIFPPGVETAYAMCADKKMAVKGMCINGDINILNGKEKQQ